MSILYNKNLWLITIKFGIVTKGELIRKPYKMDLHINKLMEYFKYSVELIDWDDINR